MTRKESKVAKTFKSLDLFGEGVSLEVDGQATHKTWVGALFSLVIIVVTISYAVTRFEVMRKYGDTTF